MLNDEALNATQVAEILHLGRNSVYAMAKSGELPSYRIGRKLFFALSDVEQYLNNARVGGVQDSASGSNDTSGLRGSRELSRQATVYVPQVMMSQADFELQAADNQQANSHASFMETANCLNQQAFATKGGRPDPLAPVLALQNRKDSEIRFALAGRGLETDLFVERLGMLGKQAVRKNCESYQALIELYCGNIDAAVISLYDQRSNSYNVPYIQRLTPGVPLVVFRLVKQMQGFAVAPGNPKGISTWSALLKNNVTIANRNLGSESRILLDEKLIAMEANTQLIAGYEKEYLTGFAATHAVARAQADVAVVNEHDAVHNAEIEFVGLQPEWVDIVVSKRGNGRQLLRLIKDMLADKGFRDEYARIVHGELDRFGSIIYEC